MQFWTYALISVALRATTADYSEWGAIFRGERTLSIPGVAESVQSLQRPPQQAATPDPAPAPISAPVPKPHSVPEPIPVPSTATPQPVPVSAPATVPSTAAPQPEPVSAPAPTPQHRCWDGQMKWRSEECPPHAVCSDGSWKHSADQCPQPQHKCWDGQMKWRSEECPPHAVCADGSWKHSADQCPQPQHQCWNGEKKWRPEECPPKMVDCLKWGGAKYADVREGTPCPKYDCLGLDGKPYAQADAGVQCVPKLNPCNDARGKFYQNVNDGLPCPPVQFHFRRIDRKRQGDYSNDVDIDYIHDQHFEELCGKELDACKLRCKELGSNCLGFAYLREEKCCRFKNRLTRPQIFRAAGVTFYERFV